MTGRDDCYFCDETECLESHHVVPRRFDGSDKEENLVTVCPTCHRKLEGLYDKRFYNELTGVSRSNGSKFSHEASGFELSSVFEADSPGSIAKDLEFYEQQQVDTYKFDTPISNLLSGVNIVPVWDTTDHFSFMCYECQSETHVKDVQLSTTPKPKIRFVSYCPNCHATGKRKIYLAEESPGKFKETYHPMGEDGSVLTWQPDGFFRDNEERR